MASVPTAKPSTTKYCAAVQPEVLEIPSRPASPTASGARPRPPSVTPSTRRPAQRKNYVRMAIVSGEHFCSFTVLKKRANWFIKKNLLCPIWVSVFFSFSNEPELGEGIDPGMALIPFSSSILDETRFEPTTQQACNILIVN